MEYFAAALLTAELVYGIICMLRLRSTRPAGPLVAWAVALCAASDLAFLLPLLLKNRLSELSGFWIGAGELADAALSTVAWLLLYLLWERRFGGEVRDGLTFWTAVGGALARLLLCAASARAWLRGEETQAWVLLRLLPLSFLAAAVTAAWHGVRLPRLRRLWLWLIAALTVRLLTAAGLDATIHPILLRLVLLSVHAAIFRCLAAKPHP